MGDGEFPVKMTGDASALVAASKTAAASMDELCGAVSRAGDESERYQNALKSMAEKTKAPLEEVKAEITDGMNPALESFTAKAEKAGGGSHDLKSALDGLKAEFPMLAHVGKLAMNPIAIGVFAVVGAFNALKAAFDGAMERINTGTGGGNFRSGMDGLSKAALDSEVAFLAYKRALEGVATAEDSVEDKSKKATAAVRARAVALAESENSQKALELARINLKEAQGGMTGTEASLARVALEDKYAQKKVRQNQDAREAEQKVKREELAGLRLEAFNQEKNVEGLRKESDDATIALSRHDTLIAESKKTKAEVDKQVKALAGANMLLPGMIAQGRSAEALQSQTNTRLDSLSGERLPLADQAKAAAERYEAGKARALQLRGAATRLGADLPGMESDATQAFANENGLFQKERLARNIGAAGQLTGEAKQGVERKAQMEAQMLEAARSSGPVTDQVLQAWKALADQVKNRDAQLAELTKHIRELEGRPPRTQ